MEKQLINLENEFLKNKLDTYCQYNSFWNNNDNIKNNAIRNNVIGLILQCITLIASFKVKQRNQRGKQQFI